MIATLAMCLALGRTLDMESAEVDSLAAFHVASDLEQVMPRDQADLIRLLGDTRYAVRQLAEAEIRRRGLAMSEALAWGSHAKDQAVSCASLRLREALYACPRCAGTGLCPICKGGTIRPAVEEQPDFDGAGEEEGAWRSRCPACDARGDYHSWDGECAGCGGTGDVRLQWQWTVGERTIVRRDLFGRPK